MKGLIAVPDWLRRDPRDEPRLEIGETLLPIVIRRMRQARRMTLRLSPDGTEVRISMPEWGRTADAITFARSRSDWLAAQLSATPRARPVAPGSAIPFRGEPVNIEHVPDAPRKPRLVGGNIILGGPLASLERRLGRWLEEEARALLQSDLAEYCDRARHPLPSLSLSRAQRRWGSCAADGSIRINWRLIMAPDFVRRSVVAHEVTHLAHFNHSAKFRAALAELFEGDVAVADGWLKRQGRGLYQPFG